MLEKIRRFQAAKVNGICEPGSDQDRPANNQQLNANWEACGGSGAAERTCQVRGLNLGRLRTLQRRMGEQT